MVQHAAAKPRESGFRVDFTFGSSVPQITASRGLFRDPVTGAGEDIDVHQAFASYVAPLGSGLRLDAGKFITPFGTEVIDGYDGWNDNATRSLLFGYAIPFTHTGVRAAYSFDPHVSATLLVVNGWDNATDNNTGKSVGAQLTFAGPRGLAIGLTGMTGPEQNDDDRHQRSLLDVTGSFHAAPRLTLGVNYDLGEEEGAALKAAARARWSGVAAYVRIQACPSFALAGRGESFNDRDGARTGNPQTLSEFTVSPEFRVTPRIFVRGDLRFDRSTMSVFLRSNDPARTQSTVLVQVLGTF